MVLGAYAICVLASRRDCGEEVGAFASWREGGHVGEAVQRRGLGLSMSACRRRECADAPDRSHRRPRGHQGFELVKDAMLYRDFCVCIYCNIIAYGGDSLDAPVIRKLVYTYHARSLGQRCVHSLQFTV